MSCLPSSASFLSLAWRLILKTRQAQGMPSRRWKLFFYPLVSFIKFLFQLITCLKILHIWCRMKHHFLLIKRKDQFTCLHIYFCLPGCQEWAPEINDPSESFLMSITINFEGKVKPSSWASTSCTTPSGWVINESAKVSFMLLGVISLISNSLNLLSDITLMLDPKSHKACVIFNHQWCKWYGTLLDPSSLVEILTVQPSPLSLSYRHVL